MTPSEPSELEPMSLERFRRLVECYGAEADHWPEAERPAAWALLALSTEAKEHWRDAARLDNMLRTVTPPAPSEALEGQLRDLPLPGPRPTPHVLPRRWRFGGWLAWPAAVAASALLAFALGWSAPGPWKSDTRALSDPSSIAALDVGDDFDSDPLDLPLVGGLFEEDVAADAASSVELAADAPDETAGPEIDLVSALPLY